MKPRLILWLAALLLSVSAAPAAAFVGLCCGKCGGNMPMNIPGGGVPETCEFRLKISPMIMHMDGLQRGTSKVDPADVLGMPAMGKFMAVPGSMDMRMLALSAGYSFTDDFFGGLMFMWQDNEMPMQFNSAMEMMTGLPGYTMESGGMADTMLMTKYRLFTDDPLIPKSQVSLLMGLSLPTGSTNEKNSTHPVAMRKGEQLPYAMQLGSGTFDPTLGLLYQGSSSPWWWGANANATVRLYDNSRAYRLGNEYTVDLYTMYQWRYNLLAQMQLNGEVTGDIGGEMDEAASGASGRAIQGDPTSGYMTPAWDPDNYGGRKLSVSAGFQWQPFALHILDVTATVPVYQRLNGLGLADDYRVMLTWYVEIPTKRSVRYGGKASEPPSQLGF